MMLHNTYKINSYIANTGMSLQLHVIASLLMVEDGCGDLAALLLKEL